MTFTLNGNETCTGTTDATGTASCTITPGEPAATYTAHGYLRRRLDLPLQLIASNGTANFVVTPEQTALTYTGGTMRRTGSP